MRFTDPNNVNNLTAQATELYAERKENRWGCYVEGSRYRIVTDFDDCVRKTYCIELSTIVKNAVPNISDDPELQSDAMIILASEFANLILKSSRHSTGLDSQDVENTVESDPQADQLSATKKLAEAESERTPGNSTTQPDTHDLETSTTKDLHTERQTGVDSNKKKVSKERQRWSEEDTAVVETVFEEELLHAIAKSYQGADEEETIKA